MPLPLVRKIDIKGNYTDKEKATLFELIEAFRVTMADDDSTKNILNEKKEAYTDNKIIALLKRGARDINGGQPRTNYTIFQLAQKDSALLIDAAVIFALMSEGILQVRNQIDFSDSGLSIAMFNKTQIYQGWASFLLQTYLQNKSEFKNSVTVLDSNIFQGIHSEFAYWSGEEGIW